MASKGFDNITNVICLFIYFFLKKARNTPDMMAYSNHFKLSKVSQKLQNNFKQNCVI